MHRFSFASRFLLRSLFSAVVLLGPASVAPAADNANLKMGNPSQATDDTSIKTNFLMEKQFYSLSYNNVKGTPNWVSWRLSKEDLGNAGRVAFKPDDDLPSTFVRITPTDYTGSGFDRGHMCPHSDRANTTAASKATFLMTNMVPQSPNNNQKAWNQLEIYIRSLVEDGKICYIVAGPAGVGGTGRNGPAQRTQGGRVVVPSVTWKVVMVLDKDVDRADQLTEAHGVRLFAAIVPNDMTPGQDWSGFRKTVHEVESLTGFSFFSKAPQALIDPLKSMPDEEPIPDPVSVHHGN